MSVAPAILLKTNFSCYCLLGIIVRGLIVLKYSMVSSWKRPY